MEHLSNDHEDHPNQRENSHKLWENSYISLALKAFKKSGIFSRSTKSSLVLPTHPFFIKYLTPVLLIFGDLIPAQ